MDLILEVVNGGSRLKLSLFAKELETNNEK